MLIHSQYARDLAWLYRVIDKNTSMLSKEQTKEEAAKRLEGKGVLHGRKPTKKGEVFLRKIDAQTKRQKAGTLFDPSKQFLTPQQLSKEHNHWQKVKLSRNRSLLIGKGFALELSNSAKILEDADTASKEVYDTISIIMSGKQDVSEMPRLYPKIYQNQRLDGIGMVWLVSKSCDIALPISESYFYLINNQGYKNLRFFGSGKPEDYNAIRVTAKTKKGMQTLCCVLAPCVPYGVIPDFKTILGV